MSDSVRRELDHRSPDRQVEPARNGSAPSLTALATATNLRPTDAPELFPGYEVVNGFRLIERISRGAVVEVWRATRPDGVLVALKCINTTRPGAQAEVQACDLMLPVRHAHLVGCFGPWERNGWLAFGMDLAEGSLLDRFEAAQRSGRTGLDAGELLGPIEQAAQGIDYLSESQPAFNKFEPSPLVHRSIQPGSLLLFGTTIRVGISRLVQRFGADQTVRMQPFEAGRTCPLTVYSAPEFHLERVSLQSDQYALAASYAHLRGVPLPSLVANHFGPFDLTQLPAAERTVVARGLAIDPANRWPTCGAFVAALDTATRLVVSLPLRAGSVPPQPLVVDHSQAHEGSPFARVTGERDHLPVLDDVLEEDRLTYLDRFKPSAVILIRPVDPAVPLAVGIAPITPPAEAAELVLPEVVQDASKSSSVGVEPQAEPMRAARVPASVLPRHQTRHRLGRLVVGLVAGVAAVLVWSGVRGSLPAIVARFELPKPSSARPAAINPAKPSVANRAIAQRPEPLVATEVAPPGVSLEATPAVVVSAPPVEPLPVAASLVVVAQDTRPEPPAGPERSLGSVAEVGPAVTSPRPTLASPVESPKPASIALPVPPPIASLPREAPTPAEVIVAAPLPGLTGTEVAAAFQKWISATLDRIEIQVETVGLAVQRWVRTLPRPKSPRVAASSVEPVRGPLNPRTATIVVLLPTAKAELVVRGEVGRGNPDEWYGPTRIIHSPPLDAAQDYLVGTFWTEAGGLPATRSQPVRVEPGRRYQVDLRSAITTAIEMPATADR